MNSLSEKEVENISTSIKESGEIFEYLEWTKEKDTSEDHIKSATYTSKKTAKSAKAIIFSALFKEEAVEYMKHLERLKTPIQKN